MTGRRAHLKVHAAPLAHDPERVHIGRSEGLRHAQRVQHQLAQPRRDAAVLEHLRRHERRDVCGVREVGEHAQRRGDVREVRRGQQPAVELGGLEGGHRGQRCAERDAVREVRDVEEAAGGEMHMAQRRAPRDQGRIQWLAERVRGRSEVLHVGCHGRQDGEDGGQDQVAGHLAQARPSTRNNGLRHGALRQNGLSPAWQEQTDRDTRRPIRAPCAPLRRRIPRRDSRTDRTRGSSPPRRSRCRPGPR